MVTSVAFTLDDVEAVQTARRMLELVDHPAAETLRDLEARMQQVLQQQIAHEAARMIDRREATAS